MIERGVQILHIRAGYINRRNIHVDLRNRALGIRTPHLVGYRPVEVDVNLSGIINHLKVRSYDLPYLRRPDSETARRHISLIIAAKAGNASAIKELKSIGASDLEILEPTFSQRDIRENEFVVSSATTESPPQEVISNKGTILLHLIQEGYPVPDFSFLTSKAYALPVNKREQFIVEAIKALEVLTGQTFGSPTDPLFIAMRCAMPAYIPGVMPTYLNVGVTERTYSDLRRKFGNIAASRIILNNLKTIYTALDPEGYKSIEKDFRPDLDFAQNEQLSARLRDKIRTLAPYLLIDPYRQVFFFLEKAYEDYRANIDLLRTFMRGSEHFPTMIFQKMVCSALNDSSYAGILFSRQPKTGEGRTLQAGRGVFGEEIMTGGIITPEEIDFSSPDDVGDSYPAVSHFSHNLPQLEREFASPVAVEFAAENGLFAMLQLNHAELTGPATMIAVMDLFRTGTVNQRRVVELIRPYHLKQLESDAIDRSSLEKLPVFCAGTSVLPRTAVSGQAYFSNEAVQAAKARGEKVILIKETFVPTDTVAMSKVDGIASITPAAVHVVTTSQSLGIPAILDMEKSGTRFVGGRLTNAAGTEINEGDWVTISSKNRVLLMGKAEYRSGRLMQYIKGEPVEFVNEQERALFDKLKAAYIQYKKILKELKVTEIPNVASLFRMVTFDLRDQEKKAAALVNTWFDLMESTYIDDVFESSLGDHREQMAIFRLLSADRQIKAFKLMLEKCKREKLAGYTAGKFVLGQFLHFPALLESIPVSFWRAFSPKEIAMLVGEWLMHQKYHDVLGIVGERKINRARDLIEKDGLPALSLNRPYDVIAFLTLKLSGIDLRKVRRAIPSFSDNQTAAVIDMLLGPYTDFVNPKDRWEVDRFNSLCKKNGVPIPELS